MNITKPGCYNIPEEEYHADSFIEQPTLSRSVIKDLIYSCPIKAWRNHPKLNPGFKREDKKSFDLGGAAHALLLEGKNKIGVVDADSWRTTASKELAESFRKKKMIPLLTKDAELITAMVEVADDYIKKTFGINLSTDGRPELSWVACINGVWVKCRTDWFANSDDFILDYKTTARIANPDDYSSVVISSGLDIQDAFYRRVVHSVTSKMNIPKFVFVVQELEEPYLCSSFTLDEMFREMGRSKVDVGMKLWKDCLETNIWPGYSTEVHRMEPKPWFLSDWEHRKYQLQMQGVY